MNPKPATTPTTIITQDFATGNVDKSPSAAVSRVSIPSVGRTGEGMAMKATWPAGGPVLVSVGNDGMGPEEFARAVYHCGDTKTWDGMCPVSPVKTICDIEETGCHLFH